MADRLRGDDSGRQPGATPVSRRRWIWLLLGVVPAFTLLVTANSAGYRFGIADQAFYIPAIQRALDPASFPHDTAVVAPQSALLASDQVIAWMMTRLGLSLQAIFLAGYLLTCALFALAVERIGTTLYRSTLATWTLLAALTLRHRIADTGVNTFEGSFHPRVLVFALGLAALAALLRRRPAWAVAFVGLGFVVHPTTALWFALWLAGAGLVFPRGRRWVLGLGAAALPMGAWMLWAGPLANSVAVMDAAWMAPLLTKDYLFPTSDWGASTWMTNAIAPAVLVIVFSVRARRGLVQAEERGLFVGALVLLAVFAVSLPFIAARVALAVQLQTSRVLWPVEFLATVYLVWALVDAHRSGAEAGRPASWARHVAVGVAVTITVAAVARGTFTLRIEHQRPLFSYGLPPTAWTDVGAWASAQTPLDAHFLADPGHAWRYGTSFRVTARRDVFLESVKDAAMATYARPIALRVSERTEAIGDFSALSPERASDLASRYDLDFLVTDRAFPFPIAFANAQFTVYALPRR